MAARRKEKDGWRLPAREIEQLVVGRVTSLLRDGVKLLDVSGWNPAPEVIEHGLKRATAAAEILSTGNGDEVRALLQVRLDRLDLRADGIQLQFAPATLCRWLEGDGVSRAIDEAEPDIGTIHVPATLQRRGVEARFVVADRSVAPRKPDAHLIALVARAHRCLSLLTIGGLRSMDEIAGVVALPASEVSRILPLAFLAPDVVEDIVTGDQPASLTAKGLMRLPNLPCDWAEQRELLRFG